MARVVAIEPVDRFIRKAVTAALTQPGPFVTPVPECDCPYCEASRGTAQAAAPVTLTKPVCLNCAFGYHGDCSHGRLYGGHPRQCECGCKRQLELERMRPPA